jgi:hypothetical protein
MISNASSTNSRSLFLVCEDGTEYIERFERFLGEDFRFVRSASLGELLRDLAQHAPIAGLLLDLDFRRTDDALLVDADGRANNCLSKAESARLAANQGIFILSALRQREIDVSVLLFADIGDAGQRAQLVRKFAPLQLVESHVGLGEVRRRLLELGNG